MRENDECGCQTSEPQQIGNRKSRKNESEETKRKYAFKQEKD